MTDTYNRKAFRSAGVATLSPLVCAYTQLVTLELYLKQAIPSRGLVCPRNHNVPQMINILATKLPVSHSGALKSLSLTLRSKISYLWCDGKDGSPCRIDSAIYPGMRYLRHQEDCSISASSDADLQAVIKISSQISHALNRATGDKP